MSQFTQDHQEWVDRENERQQQRDENLHFLEFYAPQVVPKGYYSDVIEKKFRDNPGCLSEAGNRSPHIKTKQTQ